MYKQRITLLLLLAAAPAAMAQLFADGFEAQRLATFDVQWSADTQLLEGEDASVVSEFDDATGRLVLASTGLSQRGIVVSAGDLLVIENLTFGRVLDVTPGAAETVVTLGPATLDEAIDEGEIAWDFDVGFEEIASGKAAVGKSGCNKVTLGALKVEFTCEVNDYKITLAATGGRQQTVIDYLVEQKVNGSTTATFKGKGTLKRFRSKADVSYQGGALQRVDYNTDSLAMDLRIELIAAGSNNSSLSYQVPLPVIKIPFGIGPIPASIDIGVQAVAQLQVPLAASAQATASADFSYNGDTGFSFDGSDVMTEAKLNGHDFTNGTFDSSSLFTPVDAQFGLAFPRVSLNILTQEVAWVHTGFIIGTTLTFGPVCKSGYTRLVVEGGYGFSILGTPLLSEKQTFVERRRDVSQDGCR